MARKKKEDIRIKVGIIGGLAVIIAAFVGSPYFDSLYNDRPIVDISLAGLDSDILLNELQTDDEGYFLEFVSRNRGNDDGKIIVTLRGENVQIRGGGEWAYEHSINFIIFPDPMPRKTVFHVLPDENSTFFSVELFVADQTDKQQFQKLNLISPTKIIFEKTDVGYKYVEK
ncbi:MAG: hypothetical protein OES23_01025 [Nitrosopumilus sp.]|nr:hypothetical protein [Nitrosopumilus sp.]